MTELESNGFYLDLAENIPIPVNYAIADVKDPSKRKRNYTKTIDLPDTSVNRLFFSGSFDLRVTANAINFDATKRVDAKISKNGVVIMPDAVIQLNEVRRLGKDLTFEITIFSETVDLFLLLDSIKVNELDWSTYDHTLSKANIESSWTATAGTGYYYPLIERGNGRLGTTTWRTIDFIPYVYHREVLIKILEYAGIEYESDFIDSNIYKNVLFGWGGGVPPQLSAADISQREVDADTLDFVTTINGVNIVNNIFTTGGFIQQIWTYFYPVQISNVNTTYVENTDDLNQLEDGAISVQRTGNYSLSVSMDLSYTFDIGTMDLVSATAPRIVAYRNGAPVAASTQAASGLSGTVSLSFTKNLFLTAGDFIEFRIVPATNIVTQPTGAIEQVTLDLDTNSTGAINLSCIDSQLTDGGTVVLNQFLPDMKCSDFLLGTIRHFNLYQTDPDLHGNVTIEPLPDFYSTTNVFDDISQLIDQTKEMTIKPIANSQAKEWMFIFKDNKDQDALNYLEKWEEKYGDYTYTQGSYYAKGQMKVELPWSTIVPYEIATGIIVPRFVTIDEAGVMKPQKGAPRVMMRNGQKTGNWTFTLFDGSSPTYKTSYPSVHHFDNWQDPSFDLNFKLVNEVYYTASIVTNINSYSNYYSQSVAELTSSAAMMLTSYVKWKTYDVYSLDFSRLKMINGSLWKLNAVFDFDSDVQESTKIELIKVLQATRPQARKITFTGGTVPPTNSVMRMSPDQVGEDVGVLDGGNENTLQNSTTINM